MNGEIDKLKQEIQSLKKLKSKHLICSKTELKLINEIEFYKVEKQKKLDYMESLNKIKYIQNLRKKKVQIEREKFIIIIIKLMHYLYFIIREYFIST